MEFLSRKLGVHMHAITSRTVSIRQSQYRKMYTNQPSPAHFLPYSRRNGWQGNCQCMFIDEPEILDAAIERYQQNLTSATLLTNQLPSTSNSLKRM